MPHAAIVVAGTSNTALRDAGYFDGRELDIAAATTLVELGDALDFAISEDLDALDAALPAAVVQAILGAFRAAATSSFAVQVGWFEAQGTSVEIGSSESGGEGLVSIVLHSPILET